MIDGSENSPQSFWMFFFGGYPDFLFDDEKEEYENASEHDDSSNDFQKHL